LLLHSLNRVRLMVNRRLCYMRKWFAQQTGKRGRLPPATRVNAQGQIRSGALVRVRSREEIDETLDGWDELKGCAFMEEMSVYCGTEQTVMKRVERFLDEHALRLRRSTALVQLEGAICQGTAELGRCDRSCFFFWREEWLERVE
jgi:hypothetical protein